MQTIRNKGAQAVIKEFGAELKSYNINNDELIWQSDPAIWSGSAPILFPVIGRLKNKCYKYNDKLYKMPKHGFAAKVFFDILKKTDCSVKLAFSSDEEIKLFYPFKFNFAVSFSIDNTGKLNVDYEITNTGTELMYFSLGSHPGINLPVDENIKLGDYYIELEKSETLSPYRLDNELLLRQEKPYLENENIIRLHDDLFNDDVLVFTGIKSRNIFIKNDKTDRNVKINIKNHPDLAIWSKPGAPYVCIEPCFGHDDTVDASGCIEEKPGILTLKSSEIFHAGYSIELI